MQPASLSATGDSRLQQLRADLGYSILIRRISVLCYLIAVPPMQMLGVTLPNEVIWVILLTLASTFALRYAADRQTSERGFHAVHLGHILWEALLILVLVHSLGTITWVGALFPVFIIYYACTLLPRAAAALVTGVLMLGMCTLAIGEATGLIPHVDLFAPSDEYRDPIFVGTTLSMVVIVGYGLLALTFERFARIQSRAARAEAERQGQAHALAMAVEAIRSGHDSGAVLHTIARAAVGALDGDRGAVWLTDEPNRVVRRVAQAVAPGREGAVGTEVLPQEHPFVQSILRDGKVAVINDTAEGPARELAAAFSSRSILVVPFVRSGQVVGALTVSSMERVRSWESDEIAMMSALAAQGAMALERTEMEVATAEADKLRQLNRMRDDFLRTVGHELKTPLTVVNGYLELLSHRAGTLTPERRQAILEEARANVRQITTLFDDLSDLADADAGVLGLTREPTDLSGPLRTLVAGFLTLEGGDRISAIIPETLPDVKVDEVRIRQIVGNLLANALRYAPRGPITLRAEARGGQVVISVQDQGEGIAPEYRERIWERYYRAPNAAELSSRGTGIGLALVKTLVEAHQGRVALDTGPQGSTFTVFLPIAAG